MKKLLFALFFSAALTANAVLLSSQSLNITGQTTQTAAGNNIVLATAGTGSTDADGFNTVSIQITPTGTVSSGVVTFEGSNNNTTFVAIPLYDEASLTTNPISTVSPATGVTRFFTGPLSWRYFRARISTVIGGGGSIAAVTRFGQTQFQPDQYAVTQATAANLNATVTATNLSTNIAQINAVTPLMGNGVTGTGSPRVTIASDNTANSNPWLVAGKDAVSAATTGNPVQAGGRVTTTLDTSLVQGDAVALNATDAGQLIVKPYGSAGNDWQYATPIASPITNTTAVAVKAAGAASIRNYVTSVQYQNTSATASIVTLQDGATVVWTGYAPASMTVPAVVTFNTPIRGTAATAMNFVVNTTATNTFVSAQGYQSF